MNVYMIVLFCKEKRVYRPGLMAIRFGSSTYNERVSGSKGKLVAVFRQENRFKLLIFLHPIRIHFVTKTNNNNNSFIIYCTKNKEKNLIHLIIKFFI